MSGSRIDKMKMESGKVKRIYPAICTYFKKRKGENRIPEFPPLCWVMVVIYTAP
jgi:hypothetical protein